VSVPRGQRCIIQCAARTTVVVSSVPRGQRPFANNQIFDAAPQAPLPPMYRGYIREGITPGCLWVCRADNGRY